MSLLWPESIQLRIGPDALRVVRRRQAALEMPLAADWAASLASLPGLPRFAGLHVTVADRHARYLRLNWPAGLKAAERQAFVDHRFQSVFGDGPWTSLADRDGVGRTSLAAALPAGLPLALKAWARARSLRIATIEPAFVADYRRHCAGFRGDGAFARLEAGRVTLGLWSAGQWRAVRSQPVDSADAQAAARCLSALLPALPVEDLLTAGTLHLAGATPPVDLLPAGWNCASLKDAP